MRCTPSPVSVHGVCVVGPVDETGYYEAELQGRRGLVPASYLLPLYPHAPPSSPRKHRRQVSLLPSTLHYEGGGAVKSTPNM